MGVLLSLGDGSVSQPTIEQGNGLGMNSDFIPSIHRAIAMNIVDEVKHQQSWFGLNSVLNSNSTGPAFLWFLKHFRVALVSSAG